MRVSQLALTWPQLACPALAGAFHCGGHCCSGKAVAFELCELPVGAHNGGMRRIVTCHCRAVYERTETRLIFRDSDDFACRECGEVLESWSGSRIPVFKLIKRPDRSNAPETP
jgi:hypothetical protein